jgi:hypothetical protein
MCSFPLGWCLAVCLLLPIDFFFFRVVDLVFFWLDYDSNGSSAVFLAVECNVRRIRFLLLSLTQ